MSFCSLTKGITPKICRLCVCVIIDKRSSNFVCVWSLFLLVSLRDRAPDPHEPGSVCISTPQPLPSRSCHSFTGDQETPGVCYFYATRPQPNPRSSLCARSPPPHPTPQPGPLLPSPTTTLFQSGGFGNELGNKL